ncbi:hypothetical protein JW921_01310 [Candidatus Fermentibacterales bacterium]|nr:hypothetical protein [Candidatus Fermentibacterales bacterium]
MSEERKQILSMLQEGKISVDDAERLLNALAEGERRKHKGRASAGAVRKSLGSSLDSIGEALAGIGPLISEAVGEATSGLGEDEAGADEEEEEEELEQVALEDGGFDIPEGQKLVIRQAGRRGLLGAGSGDLELEGCEGTRCQVLPEDGGALKVFRGRGSCSIRWAGGDLRVRVPHSVSSVTARTLGGDIRSEGLGCQLFVKAMGGNLDIDTSGHEFQAKTMGGNIRVKMLKASGGESRAKSMGGDIRLELELDDPLELRASTMGGEISVDPELGSVSRSGSFGRQKATIVIGAAKGDPGSSVNLKTTGGNIVIVRREGEEAGDD